MPICGRSRFTCLHSKINIEQRAREHASAVDHDAIRVAGLFHVSRTAVRMRAHSSKPIGWLDSVGVCAAIQDNLGTM